MDFFSSGTTGPQAHRTFKVSRSCPVLSQDLPGTSQDGTVLLESLMLTQISPLTGTLANKHGSGICGGEKCISGVNGDNCYPPSDKNFFHGLAFDITLTELSASLILFANCPTN